VELNFDAIEISSPEKIRLQYRLDGVDSEWLDASAPARAIYSNIPPGKHAFHIRACNRSGIWDRTGTAYYVTQQPYFYQTRMFLVATVAFGLLLIAGGYQLRLRQVVARLNLRLEERVAERTRIARELHDTLLQTFSASLLRFQSVLKMLPARPEEAKQRVENAIEQASAAIAEGRDAVQQLRVGGPSSTDLAQSIKTFLSEPPIGYAYENLPEFRIHVEGTPRDLSPMVRDEAYRIAAEALRNAIRYAGARQIEVEIRYDETQFQQRIRDDGKGIDPDVLEHGHIPGHWGLHGMRERAKLLGGNLELWSKINSGTEVELTVPAANAYPKPASRWSVLGRRSVN
jgi:signal transduction histidine kinase